MRNKNYIILILFLIFSLAHNQASSLEITPARQEITVLPGARAEGTYVVTNDSNQAEYVSASIRDWVVTEYNRGIKAEQWLNISTDGFYLKPEESKPVDFKVEVPEDARGALFAMITMQSEPSGDEVLSVAISVPVFIIVEGTQNYDGKLDNLNADKHNDTLQFSVDVHNNGNVHLRPEGRYILSSNNKNIEIDMIEGRPVYPGAHRTSIGRISASEVPPGEYELKAKVDTGEIELSHKTKFKIGKNGNVKVIN